MAMSVILQNAARTQVLARNFIKLNPAAPRVYSQLLKNVNKNNFVSKKNLVSEVAKRNMSADHSKLWPIEKAVTLVLLGVVPITFFSPNIVTDDIFAIATILHTHWGLEACCVDYVRPIIFGSFIPKATLGLLYAVSILTLGGLIYFNHNSIGIGKSIHKIWELKKSQK
ncbi:succinate dehydrogenase [ubiquinone] cytochrome b small subunit, mitochondrial [Aethina tumida]|uniref:succinate dehydrogenase [ubiquinone] cytochrome b small subunit, mitochondrial n=1 Tax=Aethina tumida TaxID=116153 RepID=UPI00096B2DE7|nr:succinate dehydrogenase [ubiquinone] cytochrome b small subunit, mitochondrial [Aethina tumida]